MCFERNFGAGRWDDQLESKHRFKEDFMFALAVDCKVD